MPQIDLPMAAELVVALLLLATMDSSAPPATVVEKAPEEPAARVLWTADTDLHAQRILRLEKRHPSPTPLP